MNSISFPNIFNNTVTDTVSDYYATKQNIISLLSHNKGELFGDPYYGVDVKKFMFDQNDYILRDIVIDDIYTALALFIPQIKVNRNDIKVDRTAKGELYVTITALNRASYQLDTYNIVLTRNNV